MFPPLYHQAMHSNVEKEIEPAPAEQPAGLLNFLEKGARFPAIRFILDRAPLASVGLVAGILILLCLFSIARSSLKPYPLDMWEAATDVVATQLSHGASLYAEMNKPGTLEPPFYSPLQPLVLSALFRITGPNLFWARLINLLAGAVFILLLVHATGIRGNLWQMLVGVAILLIIDRQLTGLWEVARGDPVPLLLGLIYILLSYRAVRDRSYRLLLSAQLLLMAGFFWKQTIVALALTPFVAALVTGKAPKKMLLAMAIGPVLLFIAAAVSVKLLNPNMFEVVYRIPTKYAVRPWIMALFFYNVLNSIPLVWLAILWRVCSPQTDNSLREKLAWAAVVCVCTFPLNLAAGGKIGGGANSFLHCMYAGGAIVLLSLPEFHNFLASRDRSKLIARPVLALSLCCALVLSFMNMLHTPRRLVNSHGYGDAGRNFVMEAARKLPGKIVCPQDPTIPLLAKGYSGVSLVNEWDRRVWKWPLPKVVAELESADYVVTFGQENTPEGWPFDEGFTLMKQLGYQPMAHEALAKSNYRIWRRHPEQPGL